MRTMEPPSGLFTPFARGEMPEGVERWEDGPPYGRLKLTVIDSGVDDDGTEWVLDRTTGERFGWEQSDCGLGCRCAADAWWIR